MFDRILNTLLSVTACVESTVDINAEWSKKFSERKREGLRERRQ